MRCYSDKMNDKWFFYIFQTYEKPRDYISKNVDLNHLPYFSLGSYRKWNRQKKTFNL